MPRTPITTRDLATRIHRAYQRRRPHWPPIGPDPEVWAVAAAALLQAHREDPRLPLDPELFVAAQPTGPLWADPWGELAQEDAIRRYRGCVERIIGGLRSELRAEVRLIRRRIRRGEAIEAALGRKSHDLSPLGRFIAACRVGRPDLAAPFRAAAAAQHRSCPLYRPACRRLIPAEAYPVRPAAALGGSLRGIDLRGPSFRWN
ncbi:MAG TPA: hypothetical protein VF590_04325 [Isosphaeraceae bacterium]|jgi:hypothetical protein